MTDNWRHQAACNRPDVDPSWFDVDDAHIQPIEAMRTCQGCPVRTDCFLEAIDTMVSDDQGVWGGTTPSARRQVRLGRLSPTGAFARGDRIAGLRTAEERQRDVLEAFASGKSAHQVRLELRMSFRDVQTIAARAGVAS